MDELLGFVDLLLRVGHDQTVEIFFLVASMSGIGSACTGLSVELWSVQTGVDRNSTKHTFALLDGAFAADRNLGTGF